jgi:serine/threonine-protein kinase
VEFWGNAFATRARAGVARWLAAGAFAVVASSPVRAFGQSAADDARADTLFKAARQLRDGGQLGEACPMFAESKRLSPGVGVALYLADCYERSGRTASAWAQFQDAENLARQRGDEKRTLLAHQRALALEPKLCRLTVAAPAGPHEGWQVLVDGSPLAPALFNVAVAVDPGVHSVTVSAPGQPPRTIQASVGSASPSALVSIADVQGVTAGASGAAAASAATPAASASPAAAPVATPPVVTDSGPGAGRIWAEVLLAGVGLAGVGLGTAWVVKRNDLVSNGGPCDTTHNEDMTSTAAAIAYSGGGAALVGALVLYLTTPSHATQAAWGVAPTLLTGGAGMTAHVKF